MFREITDVEYLDNYRLRVQFADGVSDEIDVEELITFTGVFAPLQDHEYFTQVQVDEERGTIVWPSGAGLDADALYAIITEVPLTECTPDGEESD